MKLVPDVPWWAGAASILIMPVAILAVIVGSYFRRRR